MLRMRYQGRKVWIWVTLKVIGVEDSKIHMWDMIGNIRVKTYAVYYISIGLKIIRYVGYARKQLSQML